MMELYPFHAAVVGKGTKKPEIHEQWLTYVGKMEAYKILLWLSREDWEIAFSWISDFTDSLSKCGSSI